MKSLTFAVLCLASTTVLADVYKCIETDPNTGERKVTYTNDRRVKGCERLSADLPVSSVPSGNVPKAAAPSSAFPKVSDELQKQRDADRRKILEDELAAEQKALESARKALAEQEDVRYGNEKNYQKKLDRLKPYQDKVEQHERNVEALKKEIADL
ncbi:DUF4124 domain-containing protein [Nitrogeniibacter mangrovi]|uniref:DUF4124 domain-containing protein n=1 Tax=Nitrogeniibacter mangrovi TaxID=2016596 RepID=A0A6C1B5Y0_9RHOO|nr:DUF4124 domain-containing protein [Nitrogeniibacter mangrovi]QID18867.1 DUF4124 domain-containing protein [Nitrogeniibacter mangrovi]